MTPTMNWRIDIENEGYYNALMQTGLAWLLYPDLPLTWGAAEKEILAYQAKVEYCRKTRDSNFEASSRLEGIE
jgi:hypothetical protein